MSASFLIGLRAFPIKIIKIITRWGIFGLENLEALLRIKIGWVLVSLAELVSSVGLILLLRRWKLSRIVNKLFSFTNTSFITRVQLVFPPKMEKWMR